MCIQGHSAVECEGEMWFSLAAPNPIPSTININPWLTCKPLCQFLCLHNPTAPCRQKSLRASMKSGRSGSENPPAETFQGHSTTQGINSLCKQRFLYYGNWATPHTAPLLLLPHGGSALAPQPCLPKPLAPQNVAASEAEQFLGCEWEQEWWRDCKTQQCKPLGQGTERLEADKEASTGELLWRHWGHWAEQALQKCLFCTTKGVQWTPQNTLPIALIKVVATSAS